MKTDLLYIKIDQNNVVNHKKIILMDIAKLYSENMDIVNELYELIILVVSEEKDTKYIVSVMKIIELISQSYPNLRIINLGESDFVISYNTPVKHRKIIDILKTLIVSLTVFLGSAFSIMTFNTDVSVQDVFSIIYKLILGESKSKFSILEISYSIGLPIGILIFFNHFSKLKTRTDPTPIQIQMRAYEKEVNEALIQDASRGGEMIDVD